MLRDLEIIKEIEKELGKRLERKTGIRTGDGYQGAAYDQASDGRVVRLALKKIALNKIPKAVFKLEHLVYLSVYDNQLTSLPKEIGQLTNLTELGFAAKNKAKAKSKTRSS